MKRPQNCSLVTPWAIFLSRANQGDYIPAPSIDKGGKFNLNKPVFLKFSTKNRYRDSRKTPAASKINAPVHHDAP
jgi:hypothetical protein